VPTVPGKPVMQALPTAPESGRFEGHQIAPKN
jgi:hypothetical protein